MHILLLNVFGMKFIWFFIKKKMYLAENLKIV